MKTAIRYGRKLSGIKKELVAKIDEWLSSINDESVREMASKNTIVTGGAIASMLLGEKVNDFDLYMRDKKTALALADYYVKESGVEHANVVEETIRNIRGKDEDRVIVRIASEGAAEVKNKKKGKYKVSFMSENAITLTNKIQLITRFYGEPDEIHSNYDFAHAQCYWDHGKGELHMPAQAMECLLSRTLLYTGSLYPIASIFRMKKFIERGWRISAGQQLKIMWQISEIDLNNAAVLREQLTGVDFAYLQCLIVALQDVDPEKLTSDYVAAVIDRIFD